jgi:[ribosomal protein S18]-alanine N-acetyltransferase
MTMSDLMRVAEIERLAYPSPWPPSAYRKELQENRRAHYIVVRDSDIALPPTVVVPDKVEPQLHQRRPFPLSLLPMRQATPPSRESAAIIGFAGLWLMVDEAHITTIAVHPAHRGLGVGELLLNSLVGIGYEIGARHMTLEVRVSNTIAQNLYRKYGFEVAGLRRRYYSDNDEDAYIMTTPEIHSAAYERQFARLRADLLARLAPGDGASPALGQSGASGTA